MELAIHMAKQCLCDEKKRSPRVGAVIVTEREEADRYDLKAFASRGLDDHAEQLALNQLEADFDYGKAIVYTTLEANGDTVQKSFRGIAL